MTRMKMPPVSPVSRLMASMRPVSALISREGMATPMPKAQNT